MSPVKVTVPAADWTNSTSFELVPGDLLTTYLSITDPPFDAGAVMATVAEVGVMPVTEATVGAPGTVGVRVVTLKEVCEASDAPTPFVATTLNL